MLASIGEYSAAMGAEAETWGGALMLCWSSLAHITRTGRSWVVLCCGVTASPLLRDWARVNHHLQRLWSMTGV